MSEKEYDLLVFGATSFTGKLVVEYLNENYSDLKWAIAARNQEKMDAVKKGLKCCLLYTSPSPRDSSPSRMPSSA